MNEAEWLACEDPDLMLRSLPRTISDRKQRLFAVACFRKALHFLSEEQFQNGVKVLEQYAHGEATVQERSRAGSTLRHLHHEMKNGQDPGSQVRAYAASDLYRLLVNRSGSCAARDAYHAIEAPLQRRKGCQFIRSPSESQRLCE